MRTLGIDPGIATMGWGIVEQQQGTLRLVEYGAITTPAGMPAPERLLMIYTQLTELIEKHQPSEAAIEELFFGKNVNTAISVGQARGVVLLVLAQHQLSVAEYKPNEVKQTVAGYGGADKKQMQEMVKHTLRLDKIPRPDDAADAVAIAICHSYNAPLQRRLQGKS